MPNDTQVVADGLDQKVETTPSASRWTLLVVGLAVALAMLFVFSGGTDETQPDAAEGDPDLVVPDATPGETDIAMSEAVSGFPDALVTVAATDSDTYEYLIWPREGSLVKRVMTGGDTATFDAGSQILAMTTENSTFPGFGLAVGRHTQIRPAVPSVTSFAWHDTDSGHLAYTTELSEGEWKLWHLRPNLISDQVASEFLWSGEIVAWGDWGWAIQSDEVLRLLTPDGDLKTEHPGVAYASTGQGWLFVVADRPQLVSAGGGVQLLDFDLADLGEIRFAGFSEDGRHLAVAGSRATAIYDVEEGLVAQFGFQVSGDLAFSSDGRFVVAPAPVGVVVFDLERETRSVLLEQYQIMAATVVPVSGS